MSARRILQIMRYVARRENPVSVKEIAEHLAVPRPTVYRLITGLEDEEVLQRCTESGGIELSNNFLRSMITGASNAQIIAGFEEALVCTANTWNASAFLGRLSGNVVEIVHVITPPKLNFGYVHPGLNVRPAHACSAARAILAFVSQAKADEVLGSDYSALTDKTITDKDALNAELARTQERGYAVCDEEVDAGIISVAAPITVGRAGVVCSFGIVAPVKKMREFGLAKVGEYLHAKAKGAVINLNQNMYQLLN